MTANKPSPDELMDTLEDVAKRHGYAITSINFTPSIKPLESTVNHCFERQLLAMTELSSGTEIVHQKGVSFTR
jgi:hypothetical protein